MKIRNIIIMLLIAGCADSGMEENGNASFEEGTCGIRARVLESHCWIQIIQIIDGRYQDVGVDNYRYGGNVYDNVVFVTNHCEVGAALARNFHEQINLDFRIVDHDMANKCYTCLPRGPDPLPHVQLEIEVCAPDGL